MFCAIRSYTKTYSISTAMTIQEQSLANVDYYTTNRERLVIYLYSLTDVNICI